MIHKILITLIATTSVSIYCFNPLGLLHTEYVTKKMQRLDAYAETFSILGKLEQCEIENEEYAQHQQTLHKLITDRFPHSQTPFTDYIRLLEQAYTDVRESKTKSPSFTHDYFDALLYNIERLFDYIINTQNYADEQAWFVQPIVQSPFSSVYSSYKKRFMR